jgi:hypothetical protein
MNPSTPPRYRHALSSFAIGTSRGELLEDVKLDVNGAVIEALIPEGTLCVGRLPDGHPLHNFRPPVLQAALSAPASP